MTLLKLLATVLVALTFALIAGPSFAANANEGVSSGSAANPADPAAKQRRHRKHKHHRHRRHQQRNGSPSAPAPAVAFPG